jgi:hypothetical protein
MRSFRESGKKPADGYGEARQHIEQDQFVAVVRDTVEFKGYRCGTVKLPRHNECVASDKHRGQSPHMTGSAADVNFCRPRLRAGDRFAGFFPPRCYFIEASVFQNPLRRPCVDIRENQEASTHPPIRNRPQTEATPGVWFERTWTLGHSSSPAVGGRFADPSRRRPPPGTLRPPITLLFRSRPRRRPRGR